MEDIDMDRKMFDVITTGVKFLPKIITDKLSYT